MIHNPFANGSLPSSLNTVDTIPIPNLGKIHAAQRVTDLSNHSLFYYTERMIHRHLSALLPHHPRQFGFTPSRSKSDVVALVIGKITRGLSEFSTVEYERPGGGAPHGTLVTIARF
ncbi:hypothetical protein TcCL_ESM09903 [Trypanosoma cruzi]|nr:hypothetical protein TcCL_ESM09903 [Trypanosoma cruzi]